MIRRQTFLTALATLCIVLTSAACVTEPDTGSHVVVSPLAQHPDIIELRKTWPYDLFLPTKLPEYYVRTVGTKGTHGEGELLAWIYLDIFVQTDRKTLGTLRIHQQPSNLKNISEMKVQDQSVAEIQESLKNFKLRAPGYDYGYAQINAFEKVDLGKFDGYWYTTLNSETGQTNDSQYIEFLQDGTAILLEVQLPLDVLTKDDMIKMARSFKKQ